MAAFGRRDPNYLTRHAAPELVYNGPSNSHGTLADLNAAIRRNFGAWRSFKETVSLQSIQVRGGTVTVTFSTHLDAVTRPVTPFPDNGKLVSDDSCVSTWQQQNGKWVTTSIWETADKSTLNGRPF